MKKILISSIIIKKVILIAMLCISMSANAFYTSFEYDMARLREGVNKQNGTQEQKDAFMQKIKPTIKDARDQAYARVVTGCSTDVARLCSEVSGSVDSSVKCLSDNKLKLSGSCKYIIKQNFRQK